MFDQCVPLQVVILFPIFPAYPCMQEYKVWLPFWYPLDTCTALEMVIGSWHNITRKQTPNSGIILSYLVCLIFIDFWKIICHWLDSYFKGLHQLLRLVYFLWWSYGCLGLNVFKRKNKRIMYNVYLFKQRNHLHSAMFAKHAFDWSLFQRFTIDLLFK